MIERIKEVYVAHHWPKLAASLALLLSGILLFRLEGGFPPLAWLFLFKVLPQLPTLWAQHGSATLLPLLGLLALSLTLLILWVLFVMLQIIIYTDWWRTLHTRPLAPARGSDRFNWQPELSGNLYNADDAEDFSDFTVPQGRNLQAEEFYEEEDEEEAYRPYPPPSRKQDNPYLRRKNDGFPGTRPDPITTPEPPFTTSRPRATEQTRASYQPRALSNPPTQQAPAEPTSLTRPQAQSRKNQNDQTSKRPIALPPTNYASRPLPAASKPEGQKDATSSRNGSKPPVPVQDISTIDPNQTQPIEDDLKTDPRTKAVLRPHSNQTMQEAQTPPSLPVTKPPQALSMTRPTNRKASDKNESGKTKSTRLLPAGQKAPETDQMLAGSVKLFSGSRLDPGRARKHKPNEDNLVCFQGMHSTSNGMQPFGLYVVADGMGGHANGQEASHIAISEVSNGIFASLLQNDARFEAYATLLTESIQQANHQLFLRNKDQEELMGTTITAALVVGMDAYIANVGDSRTYLYRKGAGLRQITRDHSIVARFVELGTITPDEVYSHPLRNQIYRCLGEQATVQIDSFTTKLQSGDKLLLCSDGLWEMVQNQGIQQIFEQSGSDPRRICDEFIQAALDGGGDDNISTIIVYIQQVGAEQSTNSKPLRAKVWPLEEGIDAI
ncbi:MAG TPA: protein phosphatase 2C domain-containing protein [Ktedonobacteraceae bacterium]|nr:protein phosphatase 2C domain-containing protein [Ktedonobacteraceae bacterium]